MKTRVIILALLFIFAWTFPLTHNVEVKLNITRPVVPAPKAVVQTKATWAQKNANKAMAMKFAKAGWGWDSTQRKCVHNLFMAESKFDHLAKNQQGSSAFGIGQMLREKSKDPAVQVLRAYRYIVHRYDTPCQAYRHHLRKNWY